MKNKTLLVALVALLISNVIFAYLLWSKKPHNRMQMAEKQMTEIGFDKKQVDSFIAMRKANRMQIQPIMDSLQTSRSRYIDALMKNPNDSLTIFALINESNKWVYKMDWENYMNLSNARKICNKDQLPAYDSLVKERMHFRFGKRNKQ